MSRAIRRAVRDLLAVVARLKRSFPKKAFTLDGRLVGDIGEALAELSYKLEVFPEVRRHHDAKASDGSLVQIKATMKKALTFPADHIPKFYLAIRIDPDGTFEEIFNGPGRVAAKAVRNREHPKTNLHSISITALRKLNATVRPGDRIPRR